APLSGRKSPELEANVAPHKSAQTLWRVARRETDALALWLRLRSSSGRAYSRQAVVLRMHTSGSHSDPTESAGGDHRALPSGHAVRRVHEPAAAGPRQRERLRRSLRPLV